MYKISIKKKDSTWTRFNHQGWVQNPPRSINMHNSTWQGKSGRFLDIYDYLDICNNHRAWVQYTDTRVNRSRALYCWCEFPDARQILKLADKIERSWPWYYRALGVSLLNCWLLLRYYNIARIQPWVGCVDNAPARVLVPGEQVRAQSENVQVGSFAIFPVIVFAFGLSFRGEF